MSDDARLIPDDAPNYASTTFPAPRPFQVTAHEALRQGVRDGHKNQLLMAPTGAGKSYLGFVLYELFLKDAFAKKGLRAQAGPQSGKGGADLHVTFVDRWHWDMAMYLRTLDVSVIDNRSGKEVVHADITTWVTPT